MVETVDLILEIAQRTEACLKDHVKQEEIWKDRIEKDVSSLKTTVALQQQNSRYLNGFLATIISAVTAWFVTRFGTSG